MAENTPFSHEGRSTAERTHEHRSDRSERVQEQVSETVDRAREMATENLAEQKERATNQLDSVRSALHTTSDNLRDQHQDSIAGIVDSAADQVDRLSSYVRSHSIGELIDDLQDVARREPALFIGGAAMLGILGARFLKSSQRHGFDRDSDRNYGFESDLGYEREYGRDYGYERRASYRRDDISDRDPTRLRGSDVDIQPRSDEVW